MRIEGPNSTTDMPVATVSMEQTTLECGTLLSLSGPAAMSFDGKDSLTPNSSVRRKRFGAPQLPYDRLQIWQPFGESKLSPSRTFFEWAAAAALLCFSHPAWAAVTPEISSWQTAKATQYATVVEVTGGVPKTTWPSAGLTDMGGGQATPAYSDIQAVRYSANYVYVNSAGLASYIMGPWYIGANVFGNWPSDQAYLMKFPRHPTPATGTHTKLGFGNVGQLVNGVGLFNGLDAFSYDNATATDLGTNGPPAAAKGDGIWNRSAIAAEIGTFDPAFSHQQQTGVVHFHANPKALRYQLNDNMTYTTATTTYAESAAAKHHSPILGWAFDGYPIYGPYGYSSPMNSASAVTRMRSGFTPRNGSNGTTNLTSTGRHSLPAWAATLYGLSQTLTATQYGPAVNTARPLGYYAEDNDYLGDLGFTLGTDFDLDKYNGRTCVTPEYPSGTYAYFTTIDATGAPAYPFMVGAEYYGIVTGGTVSTVSEATTTYYSHFAQSGVDKWDSY